MRPAPRASAIRAHGLALGLLAITWSPPAAAFAVLGGFGSVRQTLETAQRWDNAPGRELADGIQVSIEDTFFDELGLVEAGEVARVRGAIEDSFAAWENAGLTFDLTFGGAVVDGRLLGAELDLFGEPGGPNLCGSQGGCAWWRTEFRADRVLTTGATLAGEAIRGIDIYIDSNTFSVLFDTFNFEGALLIFQRTLRHEIGHGIGLAHPTDFFEVNFDTDLDPFNAIVVNALDPAAGFLVSPNVDCTSIMTNQAGLCDPSAAADIALHPDDIGGRDVLYPIVPEAPAALLALLALVCSATRVAHRTG